MDNNKFFEELKNLMQRHSVDSIKAIEAGAFLSVVDDVFMDRMYVTHKKRRPIGDSITDDTDAMKEIYE